MSANYLRCFFGIRHSSVAAGVEIQRSYIRLRGQSNQIANERHTGGTPESKVAKHGRKGRQLFKGLQRKRTQAIATELGGARWRHPVRGWRRCHNGSAGGLTQGRLAARRPRPRRLGAPAPRHCTMLQSPKAMPAPPRPPPVLRPLPHRARRGQTVAGTAARTILMRNTSAERTALYAETWTTPPPNLAHSPSLPPARLGQSAQPKTTTNTLMLAAALEEIRCLMATDRGKRCGLSEALALTGDQAKLGTARASDGRLIRGRRLARAQVVRAARGVDPNRGGSAMASARMPGPV